MPDSRTDLENADIYSHVAAQLRSTARYYHHLALRSTPDRGTYDTFAEPVRNAVARHYEQMGSDLDRMAEDADDISISYAEGSVVPA